MNKFDRAYYKILYVNKAISIPSLKCKYEYINLVQQNKLINQMQTQYLKTFDTSKLLQDNMYFLWIMCHWVPKQFNDFKNKLYNNFLQ